MSNTFKITEDLFWVGALDPNLKIFDIIMETKFGTSYNSYLLRGSEGIALFETVKEKFFDEHLEKNSFCYKFRRYKLCCCKSY